MNDDDILKAIKVLDAAPPFLGQVYGVNIYADRNLPINSWKFEGPEMAKFSKRVLELMRLCECHLMTLKDITLTPPP